MLIVQIEEYVITIQVNVIVFEAFLELVAVIQMLITSTLMVRRLLLTLQI